MKKINLDQASVSIKEFVGSLPIDAEGVELELNGTIVCTIVPPRSESETNMLARGRELMQRVRERNRGVSPDDIERDVDQAVELIRRRRQP